MIPPPAVDRRRRRLYALAAMIALAGAAIVATAVVVATAPAAPRLGTGPGSTSDTGAVGRPQGRGAPVPAADLVSDPVFVNSTVGFALETTETNAVAVERLARSDDGGRTWHVSGAPFPVPGGFSTLQFISPSEGYVFGDSGLVVTSDGGVHWNLVAGLEGTLQRAIPVGDNVWATFTRCQGLPALAERCPVYLAISRDAGRRWHGAGLTPLTQAPAPLGGDVLARYSIDTAYLVSYGTSGGGLAETTDNGDHWRALPDPCAGSWATVDLAAPAKDQLWMICGAVVRSPTGRNAAVSVQPKVVYRSFDGGATWRLMASSGFASGADEPLGSLPLSGGVSQLATISPDVAWLGLSGVGMIVTIDAGRHWAPAQGFKTGDAPSAVGVTFNNAVDGWAIAFRRGVWRTTDAIHWQLLDGR